MNLVPTVAPTHQVIEQGLQPISGTLKEARAGMQSHGPSPAWVRAVCAACDRARCSDGALFVLVPPGVRVKLCRRGCLDARRGWSTIEKKLVGRAVEATASAWCAACQAPAGVSSLLCGPVKRVGRGEECSEFCLRVIFGRSSLPQRDMRGCRCEPCP